MKVWCMKMSRYTTQLRWIIENNADPDSVTIYDKINSAVPKIFDFPFPIYNETHRNELEKKILMRYFNKEICVETVALWKLYLCEHLNSVMPYYNELYKTADNNYNFMIDVDYTETETANKIKSEETTNSENRTANKTNTEEVSNSGQTSATRTSSNNQTVNETGTGKTLESDLPQINYNNIDYGTNLNENETSTATTTAGTGSENNTNTLTASQNSSKTESTENEMTGQQSKDGSENTNKARTKTGLTGARTRAKLLEDYRKTILNIDEMIVKSCKDLFMMIY